MDSRRARLLPIIQLLLNILKQNRSQYLLKEFKKNVDYSRGWYWNENEHLQRNSIFIYINSEERNTKNVQRKRAQLYLLPMFRSRNYQNLCLRNVYVRDKSRKNRESYRESPLNRWFSSEKGFDVNCFMSAFERIDSLSSLRDLYIYKI